VITLQNLKATEMHLQKHATFLSNNEDPKNELKRLSLASLPNLEVNTKAYLAHVSCRWRKQQL